LSVIKPIVVFMFLVGVLFYNINIFQRFPDWHLTILSGSDLQHRRASLLEALNKGYYGIASALAQGDMELVQLSNTPQKLTTELRWWESMQAIQPNAQPVLRSLSILQKAYGNSDQANKLMQKSSWLRPEPPTHIQTSVD